MTNTITVLIVGQLLNLFDFPLNYQVVFIGSTVGALISFVFSSSIKLPSVTVPEKAEAKMENGVLTLTLPKAEEVKPKSIKVKAAK